MLVFGKWLDAALLIGCTALMLDIFLTGNPLTLFYVGNVPMHFSTLMVFVVTALALIPRLVTDEAIFKTLRQMLIVIVGIRLLWLLLTIVGLLIMLILFQTD